MAVYRNEKTGAEIVTNSELRGAWVRVDKEPAPKSEPKKKKAAPKSGSSKKKVAKAEK